MDIIELLENYIIIIGIITIVIIIIKILLIGIFIKTCIYIEEIRNIQKEKDKEDV